MQLAEHQLIAGTMRWLIHSWKKEKLDSVDAEHSSSKRRSARHADFMNPVRPALCQCSSEATMTIAAL